MRKLPSLRSMHYFEAVARHGSFTEAAKELFVSQAAVSHQVKLLEQELGTPVIERTTRHLKLTQKGEALFSAVSQALNILADTTTKIRSSLEAEASQVNLTVTPFFSAHWLIKRLPNFSKEKGSRVQFKLHHSFNAPIRQMHGGAESYQAYVTYGSGSWDGFQADYLFSADLVPMCSPNLLSGQTRLASPEDILKYPLVHEFNYEWWAQWFEQAGVRGSAVNLGPIIDDPNVLIGAALGLQGFVLGPPLFYREHIKSGMLITPLGEEIRIPIDYYFLIPTAGTVSKETLKLKSWVMDEVSKFHAEEPESLPDRRRIGQVLSPVMG